MFVYYLGILVVLLFSIIIHEFGHMISALLCGVKVKEFCVGVGKPKISKTIKGIKFSLALWLIGGYTALEGEYSKENNGFLSQRYLKKLIIVLSGVALNFLVAIICYKINYDCIKTGIYLDWNFLLATFSKDHVVVQSIFLNYQPNIFLLMLGFLNFICAIINLLPIPPLDGSLLWLFWLEKPLGKNYGVVFKKLCRISFIIITLIQIPLIVYLWI